MALLSLWSTLCARGPRLKQMAGQPSTYQLPLLMLLTPFLTPFCGFLSHSCSNSSTSNSKTPTDRLLQKHGAAAAVHLQDVQSRAAARAGETQVAQVSGCCKVLLGSLSVVCYLFYTLQCVCGSKGCGWWCLAIWWAQVASRTLNALDTDLSRPFLPPPAHLTTRHQTHPGASATLAWSVCRVSCCSGRSLSRVSAPRPATTAGRQTAQSSES